MDKTTIIVAATASIGLMIGAAIGWLCAGIAATAADADDDPMEHPPPRVMTRIWADNVTPIKGQSRDPHL